jgi:hypothetical protein
MTMTREGQVRAEYQLWFPQLVPGIWYPAADLTRAVLEQIRSGEPRWTPGDRMPSDAHFLFRGGDGPRGTVHHSRRDDPPTSSA